VGYMSTADGVNFDVNPVPVVTHAEHAGQQFDAEGVHKPSVFTFGQGEDGIDKYWMLYAGYNDVIATSDPGSSLIFISQDGESLGMASSAMPDQGWQKLGADPLPLDVEISETLDSPRAFFINGRLHVFFTDTFEDPDGGDSFTGIGLGIAPFPVQETP